MLPLQPIYRRDTCTIPLQTYGDSPTIESIYETETYPLSTALYMASPAHGQVKINVDGALKENLGPSGYGLSFRDYEGNFMLIVGKTIELSVAQLLKVQK
ncbi:hypothetical protein IFM89_035918 [Coptis chinensis]|uniref:RNase H type-1 domain-containing protein n=1 Tax=Coptis chinensis TaxID=261450 RepID=A0A835GZQ9_9MAGN|nr:hypothetical protein IFM89_035918 [Coptis chinensis]